MKKIFYPLIFTIAAFQLGLFAQQKPLVGIVDKLGQTVPLDEQFFDENGSPVALGSIIHKPTILTFVYYKCPGICTPLLNEVAKVVEKMDLELGKDYQIVTLSFDPEEKPDLAADKKDTYLSLIKRKIDPNGWRFLTGDSTTIHRLTDAAGFYYIKNPDGTWLHAGTLIIISPSGKIARYLYGVQQLPLDVKMALLEASEGRTGPTIAKVLAFCYSYDPEGKHYTFNIVHISGIVIVGLVVLFVGVFLVKPKKKE